MMPQIYKAIEDAVAHGVPPQYIAYGLIQAGWPPVFVNDAVQAWLASHGKFTAKTEFKTWLKKYHGAAFMSVVIITILNVIRSTRAAKSRSKDRISFSNARSFGRFIAHIISVK